MRETYSNFIHQVGRNIYPFILASDYEPGFEGVGSTFTLFLRDGRYIEFHETHCLHLLVLSSQHKVAPAADSKYEVYKAISHAALAMFIILSPHFKNPKNLQWKAKILQLQDQLVIFQDAVTSAHLDPSFQQPLLDLVNIYLDYIKMIIDQGSFELEGFLHFTALAFEKIRGNMAEATREQARAILPAMLKWKQMLGNSIFNMYFSIQLCDVFEGPEEWSKVYVVIPTVWPVALNSPRLQLFHRVIDSDKIHTHIITSEYPRSMEEARTLLGRVVGDRSVGRLVFGTRDTKAKMKVLALSSRTDVVADDFEIALNEVIGGLSEEDKQLMNPSMMMSSPPVNGGCPIKHQATHASKTSLLGSRPTALRGVSLLGSQTLYDVYITPEGMSFIAQLALYPLTMTNARGHLGHCSCNRFRSLARTIPSRGSSRSSWAR